MLAGAGSLSIQEKKTGKSAQGWRCTSNFEEKYYLNVKGTARNRLEQKECFVLFSFVASVVLLLISTE